MASFGERLRQLRREAGLSQAELAGDDLSASYISLLESGKRAPSGEVVQQLAARLGCSSTHLLEGRASDRDQRIELELAYARLAITHGEAVDARNRLERLLAEDGIPLLRRDEIILSLGRAHERAGSLDDAVRLLTPLYERALRGATHLSAADLAQILCYCYQSSGDHHQVTVLGGQALAWISANGLAGGKEYFRVGAMVMYAYAVLGDLLHARMWAERLVAEAEAVGERGGAAVIYWNAALVAEQEGRLDDSLALANKALANFSEMAETRNHARLLVTIAGLDLVCDPPLVTEAANLLERAREDLQDVGSRADLAEWNTAFARVLLFHGDPSSAEGRARQALHLVGPGPTAERVASLLALHDCLVAQGRDDEAAERRTEALAVLRTAPASRRLGLGWRDLAERAAEAGDAPVAFDAFRHALETAAVRDRDQALRRRVAELREGAAAHFSPR
jgi:transcriptional regulator with XRE-family HTH domain